MGIEQFFSTIKKHYKSISLLKDTDDKIETEYIFMDFNSVIHNITSSLDNIDTEIIIKNIDIFLLNFLNKFNLKKLKLLYIALDGVPSFGKIIEQKKRRYIGNILNNLFNNTKWSKNNISPGTIFMDELSKYLNNLKIFNNIKISDSNEPGEGEMKILDIINTIDINSNIIFFSPDSDVILLCMISKNNNINIIKQEKENDNYSIVDISKLKQSLYDYCSLRIPIKLNLINLINDLVFIFTIFGNDFLPKCEAINTNLDIFLLIDMYLIMLIDNDYIIINNNINSNSLFNFFKLLNNHEERLLYRNAFINIYSNYNIVNQRNFIMDLYNLQNIKPLINSFTFGKPYYNFYNNIISFIDPTKLNIKNEKYGYLYFYLMDKYELLNIIINTDNILDTLNNIIKVKKNDYGDYQQIHVNKYTSKTTKHQLALENLSITNDREKYLIENKLDKYFKIFNPINKFYEKSIKSKILDIDFYYSTYFYNIKQKKIVKEYLKGLKWILEYYYIRKNINNYWHYKFKKTPLFKTIIKYYNPKYIAFNFEKKEIDLLPYEQLLYIIPKPSDDDLNMLFPNEYINKIKIFIKKYPEYFLDNITHLEGMFDCSNSLYVNKCDCLILEKIINIKKFVKKLRNI